MKIITLISLFLLQPVSFAQFVVVVPSKGNLVAIPQVCENQTYMGKTWVYNTGTGEYELEYSRPQSYFDGRVILKGNSKSLDLSGWRYTQRVWTYTAFSLTQTLESTKVSYTIRTPAGQPDITITIKEKNTTLVLIRHPEVRPMLAEILNDISPDSYYEFDKTLSYQVNPEKWVMPEGLDNKINAILLRLNTKSWKEVEQAEKELIKLDRDAFLYFLIKHNELNPQQSLVVGRVLAEYPVLDIYDKEQIRKDPSILDKIEPFSKEATTKPTTQKSN